MRTKLQRVLLEGSGESNLGLKRVLKTKTKLGYKSSVSNRSSPLTMFACHSLLGGPEPPAIRDSCLSSGIRLNDFPRCFPASIILYSAVMKTLLIKENDCLIQCLITAIKIQVDSYQWI